MVLGPPKMSFASSSARTSTGNKFDQESTRSASISTPTFDDDRGDAPPRFGGFKNFGGFVRGEERDKEAPARDFSDLRGGFSKRRDDSEGGGWTSVSRQPRKSFGAEDGGDRERFRKELRGDVEKKGTPWDRDRPAKYENFGKERDREHRGRGKRDESSWLLDDARGERTRDDRRDNNRFGSRAEKDPEWMDSDGKAGDSKAAHSMEDFQKWKERMKASSVSAEPLKKAEEPVEKVSEEAKPPAPQPALQPVVVEEKADRLDRPPRQGNSPPDEAEGGILLGRCKIHAKIFLSSHSDQDIIYSW